MLDIPIDILQSVFFMDGYYIDYMRHHVLPFIHRFKIFFTVSPTHSQIYLVWEQDTHEIHVLDDFDHPSFVSTSYNTSAEYIQQFRSLSMTKTRILNAIEYSFTADDP